MGQELLAPAKDLHDRVARLELAVRTDEKAAAAEPFLVAVSLIGKPGAGAVLVDLPLPIPVTFPKGLTDSQAHVGTNPTAEAVYHFQKDGVEFGTLTIGTDGTLTWAASAQTAFVKGERLSIVAPASQDSTLSDVAITLLGTR